MAGNWKLHKTPAETRAFVRELGNRLVGMEYGSEVVVCPPSVSLETAVDAARGTGVAVGAQNVFWETSGAFTGETSSEMLESVGASHVIIGHSERRHVFGETNEEVGRKLRKVLAGRLVPIVCVGELLEERESGRTEEVVGEQIRTAFMETAPDHAPRLIVAYEPVWAIGTGRTATPEMANDVHALIRRLLGDMLGRSPADEIRILYGGSVKPDNASGLMAQSEIDGVLVGGASLSAESFAAIVGAAG